MIASVSECIETLPMAAKLTSPYYLKESQLPTTTTQVKILCTHTSCDEMLDEVSLSSKHRKVVLYYSFKLAKNLGTYFKWSKWNQTKNKFALYIYDNVIQVSRTQTDVNNTLVSVVQSYL